MILAKIYVTLKKGILDPQGKTVHHALDNLGIGKVGDVRIGKYIEVKFENASVEEAKSESEEACKKLLANPVVEDYSIHLETIES